MPLPLETRKRVDWILGKIQVAASSALVVFGASLKANPEDFGFVQPFVQWMQSAAWLVVVCGPITIAVLQAMRRKFGNPWAWEAMQKCLDEFSETVFGDIDEPVDHHRATLFRYKKFHICWNEPLTSGGWLVAVARSDHLSKRRIRKFKAPDNGDKCEGVVGMAWRRRSWVRIPSASEEPLPQITRSSSIADIDNYASRTGVSAEWIQNQIQQSRAISRSYAALQVKLKGKPWGVLVLDSKSPLPIDDEKLKAFKAYANLMTPILERA